MLRVERLSIKMALPTKVRYRFRYKPMKIQLTFVGFFAEIENSTLKFTWNLKGHK